MRVLKSSMQYAKEARLSEPPTEGARRTIDSRFPSARNALEETIDLYSVRNWGGEYFDVNRDGEVVMTFEATRGTPVALKDIVTELRQRGVSTPVVLRFPQILDYQIKKLVEAFKGAIQEFGYRREYVPVYPIKVNQK